MNGNQGGKLRTVSDPDKSAGCETKRAATFEFPSPGIGQNGSEVSPQPQHKPRRRNADDPLGDALSIEGVAELLGYSVWTVRKKCLPRGLPHLRIGTTGKLVFYRAQVTRWILEQQELYRGRR